MKNPSPVIFLCVLCLCASKSGAAPNLIINGSFEEGFAGWQGTWGYYENSPNPVSGRVVGVLTDISHSSVGRTMYQNVPTVPGQMYQISFALRLPDLFEIAPGIFIPVVGESSGGSTTISLRLDQNQIAAIPVTNRDTWNFYSYNFTAADSNTEVYFFNPSVRAWPFIDAVTLTAVPEPQALVVVGLCLGRWLTRRRPTAPGFAF